MPGTTAKLLRGWSCTQIHDMFRFKSCIKARTLTSAMPVVRPLTSTCGWSDLSETETADYVVEVDAKAYRKFSTVS